MKVKDLIKAIDYWQRIYPDILEWDVALEQHEGNPKECKNCQDNIVVSKQDSEVWKFIKSHCMGCCTMFPDKKILGLQIHY